MACVWTGDFRMQQLPAGSIDPWQISSCLMAASNIRNYDLPEGAESAADAAAANAPRRCVGPVRLLRRKKRLLASVTLDTVWASPLPYHYSLSRI